MISGYSNLLFQHSLPAGNWIPKPWEQKSRPNGNRSPDRMGTTTPTDRETIEPAEQGEGRRPQSGRAAAFSHAASAAER